MFVQFSKFAAVGVLNTFVGLLTIYMAKWIFSLDDVTANIIGYSVGLAVSFLLNKSWTFRHRGEVAKTALRFIIAFAIAYPINLGTVLILIRWGEVNSYLAQALGMPPYMIAFFLLSRHFSFRQRLAINEKFHNIM